MLLMAGDAKRHYPTNDPLFGFAGTVNALGFKEGANGFRFHFGTDGSGFDAISFLMAEVEIKSHNIHLKTKRLMLNSMIDYKQG